HRNSGTITLHNDMTINQGSSAASFRNSGTIGLPLGRTLTMNGGTFHHDVGQILGGGTLALPGATWNLTNDFTNTDTNLLLVGTTISGSGSFINAASRTLSLKGSTVNVPLVNEGILIAEGNVRISGPFTTTVGSILRVLGTDTSAGAILT